MKTTRFAVAGIDLAAKPSNPTGWAVLEGSDVLAKHLFADEEVVVETVRHNAQLAAVDAPLSLPSGKHAYMRKADREMHRQGYAVLPPGFESMQKLASRTQKVSLQLQAHGLVVIEVHPLSSRKALGISGKDWAEIQTVLRKLGVGGDLHKRSLTSHEIDAITAALTGYLHLKRKTELVGDLEEGCIVVPRAVDWRTLKL